MSFDPFAGNDFRGLESKPAETTEAEQSEDPFACLM